MTFLRCHGVSDLGVSLEASQRNIDTNDPLTAYTQPTI
jgi:hypothetical protein